MKLQQLTEFREIHKAWFDELGNLLIEAFHYCFEQQARALSAGTPI